MAVDHGLWTVEHRSSNIGHPTSNIQPLKSSVPFNKPYQTGNELHYIQEAINRGKISGNGHYTHLCQDFFEKRYGFQKCLLTTSCTDALEMAAILLDIQPGDEVIVPSFTFVSTANAFVLRGARIVFVDSKADHPNMDEQLIESLITPKTKAIVVVHYAGVACEMDVIMDISNRHGLFVVEDAAQAIESFYGEKALGGIGHLGCLSFHETKNIQCGEGGMLIINDPRFIKRAEIIWEKGTDRAAFFRGEVDKYSWVDTGSSFLPSELNAAFLWDQLENLDAIQTRRKSIWEDYYNFFSQNGQKPGILQDSYLAKFKDILDQYQLWSKFQVPEIKDSANAHMFYLLFDRLAFRTSFIECMKEKGVMTVFHYQSLHSSPFAKKTAVNITTAPNSDHYSDCLVRLPLFFELDGF